MNPAPTRSLILLLLVCLLQSTALVAQDSTESAGFYSVDAYRLQAGETFRLDGRMNEPFWDRVTPATNFTQQEPAEGAVPNERTEVYIAYDDNYLYIAAKLYDSQPEGILAYQKRRNQGLGTDDRFMWTLDTFRDGRNAYFFETNPAGLMGDGLLTAGQRMNLNKAWDGIWDVRTTVNVEGWIAEIRIPFRSLDYDPESSSWGINFQRTVRRNNEEILWAGWRRNQGLFRPQHAGVLNGLEGLSQGLGLEVTPYATGTANRTWPPNEPSRGDLSADAGFDASYNITPSITTSLTVNTDFAETEVDERQVNLTRFSLVFPEQRNFFLESAGIFSFVPESNVMPFFSRRIGLIDGEPVPLLAGAQVIGREGDTHLGFYQIRTGRRGEVNPEDFTAARVRQNIFRESSIGVIYTRRATLEDDQFNDRHTAGVDLELSTSRFMGDKNLQLQTFFVWHNRHTPDEGSSSLDRSSGGFRLTYPNYPFSGHVSYRELGTDFDPAVGFAPRVGIRRLQPSIGFEHIFSESELFRSWESSIRYEYLTDMEWTPETVDITFTPIELRFESGEEIEADLGHNYEFLAADFDILRDGTIVIPAGEYRNWRTGLEVSTAGYRRVSGEGSIRHEGFWTGSRTVYDLALTVRPWPGVNLSASWSRTDAELDQGDFQADLLRFTGNVDLTPFTTLTNIVQYDNLSNLLGLYNRFRWTLRPGADLYLVHTWNWVRIGERFDPLETQGAVKISFTHRF